MVKWDKEYYESTGKWRPLKEYTKKVVNGKVKYSWDDPIFLSRQRGVLEKTIKHCGSCNMEYNLSNPCIHHLPDIFKNDIRRKAYYKKIKGERKAYLARSVQKELTSNA